MEDVRPKPEKPLGHKAYGSIPHLIGSRRGPGDIGVNEGQHRICTEKARDKHDVIIVQEKLDGTCVSVANIDGEIIPLIRAGYVASGSNYKQHHMFFDWVWEPKNMERFKELLKPGERVVGEWLAQAHGTRYTLLHDPFVVFDLMRGTERATHEEVMDRCWRWHGFDMPSLLSIGSPMSVEKAMLELGKFGRHGAMDIAEGAVWRVERQGKVDFLAKYVRPEKGADGKYLECVTGGEPVWNWQPGDKI